MSGRVTEFGVIYDFDRQLNMHKWIEKQTTFLGNNYTTNLQPRNIKIGTISPGLKQGTACLCSLSTFVLRLGFGMFTGLSTCVRGDRHFRSAFAFRMNSRGRWGNVSCIYYLVHKWNAILLPYARIVRKVKARLLTCWRLSCRILFSKDEFVALIVLDIKPSVV